MTTELDRLNRSIRELTEQLEIANNENDGLRQRLADEEAGHVQVMKEQVDEIFASIMDAIFDGATPAEAIAQAAKKHHASLRPGVL
jgi:regulator of replication initiation timing